MIIEFFDRLNLSSENCLSFLSTKKEILDKLKEKWKVIYNQPKPLRWLPEKDEESCIWVWDCLKEKIGRMSVFETPSNFIKMFKPSDNMERYLAICVTCDLWNESLDSKKLLMINLNKAWNQRKLRKLRTDKKAINCYLRNETKERLDKLAMYYEMRISDVLEKLINERYKKVNDEM
ncbi:MULTISPECIES: hypothetical protein [unclassified Brenneria]|uniref:hypothetical protein n=1 Tax=unclassified Brenneria TaxID=2634434 RepID=UPI0029C385CA|nr:MULTISPECIES: hypothetical protein [unclassified Brenneria]MDX5629556.1 hypothetical protein [Brenneria sp. L3-3Z]MDX5696695.1 hypothetical protein [Brenneria sp. L4-2C]